MAKAETITTIPSKVSRRLLVTGAAALPALAVPTIASAGSDRAGYPVTHPDPRLLALAEELKPVWSRLCFFDPQRLAAAKEAQAESEALHLEMTGTKVGSGLNATADQKFWRVSEENGYLRLADICEALFTEVIRLADAILEIPAADRMGDAIRLAAILMKYPDDDCSYSDLLWEMAAPAGFTKPDLDEV
jgi:hypothetical protein